MTDSTDSSNIFQDVLNDANAVEEKYLGKSYPYYSNIRTPAELGMSSTGSLSALGKDIDGLVQYVDLLVSGNGKASSTGQPLGNNFFLKTGGKCLDPSGAEQERYIFVQNISTGNIPFISSGMGVNFKDFKGLVPSVMQNLNQLNPYNMLQAFMMGSEPDCQQITMETVDVNNNRGIETNYVATVDIKNMDACSFPGGKNPVSGAQCKETFTNLQPATFAKNTPKLPTDPATQLYFAGLAGLGIYCLFCLSKKG